MIDQHRFDDLHEVMTDDCTAAYSDGEYSFDDLAGIIAFLHENMGRDQFLSSHACHHPEIDIYDDGTATGIWKLEDQVIITDFGVNLRGAAFYEDRYLKTERGWKITHTGYSRTFEEMHPATSIEACISRWASSADPEDQPECRHAGEEAERDACVRAITTPASTRR